MADKKTVDIKRIFFFGLALIIVMSSLYLIVDKYLEHIDLLYKDGTVEIKRPGSKDWFSLTEDTRITLGCEIRTGDNATVELELPGESYLKVGENSHVKINEIGMVEITKRSGNSIELLYGKVRAIVAPFVNKKSKFLIETNESSIGVRGTDFGVIRTIDENKTNVLGLDGEVSVESNDEEVIVKADEEITIVKDETLGVPTELDEDFKRDYLIEMDFVNLNVEEIVRNDLKDIEIDPEAGEEIIEVELPKPEDGKSYTVKPGDSLWKIAEELYGEGIKYPIAYDANRKVIKDPSLIYPNQVIIIPQP